MLIDIRLSIHGSLVDKIMDMSLVTTKIASHLLSLRFFCAETGLRERFWDSERSVSERKKRRGCTQKKPKHDERSLNESHKISAIKILTAQPIRRRIRFDRPMGKYYMVLKGKR